MSLTQRQQQFLERLRELCRRARKAVHYSDLATNLGVSKWSAYDMMHTLEQKGMVQREYVMKEERPRGGRSRVAFRPAETGRQRAERRSGRRRDVGARERVEWRRTRAQILRELEQEDDDARSSVLRRLLAAIPRQRARLAYCGQLLAALLLRLRQHGQRTEHAALLHSVSQRLPQAHAKLMVLAGLAGGLSLHGEDDSGLSERFGLYVHRYERYVREMSAAHRRALLRFFQEVVRKLSLDAV